MSIPKNGASWPVHPHGRVIPGLEKPIGTVIQYAYTVPDMDAAMAHYTAQLGVGPWFVTGPFTPPAARYRGQPTAMSITLARAFVGTTMIELVAQHDEEPSVYREFIDRTGYGFHHWAIGSDDIEADVATYAEAGLEKAFEDVLPSGGRVVYVDASSILPGMIELVEMVPAQEEKYLSFYRASISWDGTDPVRLG